MRATPLAALLAAALVGLVACQDASTAAGATAAETNATASAEPAVPTGPVLRITHPTLGGAVNSGVRTLLDVKLENTPGGGLPEGYRICMLQGADDKRCWTDTNPRFLMTGEGNVTMLMTLERPAADGSGAWEVVSRSVTAFASVPSDTCNGTLFARSPCMITRPHCGRFLKFRFFLYPQQWLPTAQAAALYRALRDHPLRTDDPYQACVYIGLTDLKAANVVREPAEAAAARLYRLPLWGNGENHIVFTMGDYGPGYDTQRAMIAAPSFGEPVDYAHFYRQRGQTPPPPESLPQLLRERAGYDIVLPPFFYRCNMGDFTHLHKFDGKPIPDMATRPYLLTFKGAAYSMAPGHPAEARVALRRTLHNGRDIHVALSCWGIAPTCDACEPPACTRPPLANTTTATFAECAAWTAEAQGRYDYEDLLLGTRFAAILPGEGAHSYRLYEALQAGAIPVFIGASTRPLEPLIHWPDVAIIQADASPAALTYLEASLRIMPLEQLRRMQRKGREVFAANLADLPSQLSSMFALLSHRFDASNRAILKELEEAKKEEERRNATAAAAGAAPAGSGAAPGWTAIESLGAAKEASATPAAPAPASVAAAPSSQAATAAAAATAGILSAAEAAAAALAAPGTPQRRLDTAMQAIPATGALLAAQKGAVDAVVAAAAGGGIARADLLAPLSSSSPNATAAAGLLRGIASNLLSWLHAELPSEAERQAPAARVRVADALALLSQVYSALGEWRHAGTASQALMLYLSAARDARTQADDTRRIRNAAIDSRRPPPDDAAEPTALSGSSPQLLPGGAAAASPRQLLHRLSMDLSPAVDAALLSGYGSLAHFLGPQPLGVPGAPSVALPLALGLDLPPFTTPAALAARLTVPQPGPLPLSHALLTDAALKRVAVRLQPGGQAQARIGADGTAPGAFPSTSSPRAQELVLPLSLREYAAAAAARPQAAPVVGRVAIVSLCAYSPAVTNLTAISKANLEAYCNRHGYKCFMGVQALDPARPPAWSKVVMTALLLPRYEWVMWRDCDSFFTDPGTRIETVIAAAAHARAQIALATGEELQAAGQLTALQAEALRGGTRGSADAGGCVPRVPAPSPSSPSSPSLPTPLPSSTLDLVLSEDAFMLNTGVFLLRNSAWGHGWLRRMYGVPSPLQEEMPRGATLEPFGGDLTAAAVEAALGGNSQASAQLQAMLAAAGVRIEDLTSSPAAAAAAAALSAGEGQAGAGQSAPPPSPRNALSSYPSLSLPDPEALGEANRALLVGGGALRAEQVQSRLWEQGTALSELAMGQGAGVAEAGQQAQASAAPASAANASTPCGGAPLASWEDALHAQFVPQRWLNSYPAPIARQLRTSDAVESAALHAEHAPGDWIVSFSGCTVYMPQAACNRLMEEWAAAAAAVAAGEAGAGAGGSPKA